MKLSNRLLASIAVAGVLAAVPAAAQAGTVSTEAVLGSPNKSILRFTASPGEQNKLSVTSAVSAPGAVALLVRDTGAPLTVGSGCAEGGSPGSIAVCVLHPAQGLEYEYCGRDCSRPIPGTAWETSMNIALGDGDDSFDGSALSGSYDQGWRMTVDGGAGNDTILTGGSKDTITPGPGNDVVRSGGDVDRVIADAGPDGNDLLELGSDTLNGVDDSARTEPLHLANGVLGGAGGEEDRFTGFIEVIGGSGNDEFRSDGEWLRGGPGDDTLTGSPGKDYIFGGSGNDVIRGEAGDDFIYGGDGDDRMEGGAGNDMIEEREEEPKEDLLLGASLEPSGGNDVIEGGEGNDFVLAGLGNDSVGGGLGDDRLYGEAGNDTLEGGAGNDEVAGDEGADVMRGGEGNDRLLSAYDFELIGGGFSGRGIDTAVDSLDCGPGEDSARTNSWDHVENCERSENARAVMVKKVSHNRAKGTATISFILVAMEPVTVKVHGNGVRPLSYAPAESTHYAKEGKLVIRPTSAALAKLRHRGHLKVTLALTLAPTGKPEATETREVNLVMKKKPARHHHGAGGRR